MRHLLRRAGALALPLAFALLTALVAARFGPLLRLDAGLGAAALRFTRSHHTWRAVMSAVTHTADRRVLLSAMAFGAAFALGRRDRAGLAFLAAAAAGSAGVRLAILAALHRARPPERVTAAAGWAFPSGHTTSATVAAGILVVLLAPLRPGRTYRAALIAAAGAWAGLVGVSRVALGAHWPSDVLGGWLLAGSVVAGLSAALDRRRRAGRHPDHTAPPAPPS